MIRGYVRVSTNDQTQGTSPETQRETLKRFAAWKGEDPELYEDLGVSGSIPLDERPDGRRLVADLRKGDTLVVAKLDRLFRSATDALVTAESLERRGILLVLLDVSDSPVNAGGVGKMIFTIMAAFAEMERTRILERTAAGRDAKKRSGGHMGGVAPFGWRVVGRGKGAVLEPVPEQQAALATIRQAKEAGLSLRKIQEAVRLVHGLDISHVAIGRITKEGRYGND